MLSHTPENVTEAMLAAYSLARRREFQQAEEICDEILRRRPDHAEAHLLRGMIELQTGRISRAVASISESIRSDSSKAIAHALLGDALLKMNRPEDALTSYDKGLRLDPGLISAHYGRGGALLDLHRPGAALESYDRVIHAHPDDSEALFNRGNALMTLQKWEAALDSFDSAIRSRPAYAAAHNNRGSALAALRRIDEALRSFDEAIDIQPAFAEAHHNRGCLLREAGRPQDAFESFERALSVRPDHVEALFSRGDVLRDLNRPAESIASYDSALGLRGDCVEAIRGKGDALLQMGRALEALAAHDAASALGTGRAETCNSRGNSLRLLNRFPEAIACYDEAILLDSDNPVPHFNRGTAFLQWDRHVDEALVSYARALHLKPDFAFVPGALYFAQQIRADWTVRAPAAGSEGLLRAVVAGKRVIAPFPFLSAIDSAAAQQQCAQIYAEHRRAARTAPWSQSPYRHERIRVAYVTSDFREHAVSYLLGGVLEKHDLKRIEPIAVSLRPAEDTPMGRRIKNAFDRFIDVSTQTDEEVIKLLRSLEIDIAVDLSGYTDGFRPQIFAQRAAPIQVNLIGYPGTMGSRCIDYIIADDFVIPHAQRRYYSESVVYLPECFQPNDDMRPLSERHFARSEAGLPQDAFVFCCLNNIYKINPKMFDIWMRLLNRVQGGVLWLLGTDETIRGNLRREAAQRGIDPERLVFAAREPYPEYLRRLELADLFVDTLPFNGGTTASDALWAGLPVLTCAGESFAARMAGSLLRAVGLPELISDTLESYEARAIELAQDGVELQALRRRLQVNRNTAPLFDTDRYRRDLESAFEEMQRRQAAGMKPASFAVEPSRPT